MATVDPQKSEELSAGLDPFHMMVGRITSLYAMLEHAIDQAIWNLAEVNPALGASITSQLGSTTARIRALVALLYLREGTDDFINKLNRLNQRLHAVTDIRNRAVHDAWTIRDDGQVAQLRVAISKKDNKIEVNAAPITMAEMNDKLVKVSNMMRDFVDFTKELESWRASWPCKWREQSPVISLGEWTNLATET